MRGITSRKEIGQFLDGLANYRKWFDTAPDSDLSSDELNKRRKQEAWFADFENRYPAPKNSLRKVK